MDVAVILAAGRSSRFLNDLPKQLYQIGEKPIINWSIDILKEYVQDVIIVTNSDFIDEIKFSGTILINDVDNRIQSIKVAVDYLENKNYTNILIHDAARPFISSEYLKLLINSSKKYKHSQYYLELVNGLARRNDFGWEIAPRQDFIELCTPQITDFSLFKFIFREYIETNIYCEVLQVMSKLGLDYNLIKGSQKYLRKITTIDDIF